MLSGWRTRYKNANGCTTLVRIPHGSSRRRKRLSNLSFSVGRFPPPNRQFVECTEQGIRVSDSEVGELLREYQRLVEAVCSAGGSRVNQGPERKGWFSGCDVGKYASYNLWRGDVIVHDVYSSTCSFLEDSM